MGDIECVSAKERGYMVCPIASLAGARIVSSFSKTEAIWESNLSGDKSRRDGGKGEGGWAGSLLTGCGGLLAKDGEAAVIFWQPLSKCLENEIGHKQAWRKQR